MAMASCALRLHTPTTTTTSSRILSGPPPRFLTSGASSRKASGRRKHVVVCGAAASQRVTFQSSVYTDLVLRQFQTVSFEQYMEDEDRIFDALFPDTRRRQKLNDTRWELRGLDYQVKPSELDLGILGSLYPEQGGLALPRLKGQMELTVDLAIPPSLGLIPPPIIESFGKALLSQLLENMKDRVNNRLLQDYNEYARQRQARLSSA